MSAGQLITALAAAAVLGAASSSCTADRTAGRSASDTAYVGVAASRANTPFFRGVQLALDKLNAERPAGSPPLGLRLPPDSQPSQVAVAARFRDDPTVIGVVGHTGSAQTMDAAPVYGDVANEGRNGVAAVTPTATNPQVTLAGNWVFRVCPTDDDAARALARFAIDSIRARRIAIIYRNDLFGRGFTRTILPELSSRGASVTERDPYLAGVTEYQAYATRIARSSVDAVLFAGGGADAADLIRALHELGAHPPVLGSDDVANILSGVKPIAPPPKEPKKRGVPAAPAPTDDRELFRGVRYAAFYNAAQATTAEEKHFVAEYRRRFGQAPNHQAALSYDAATLIGHAMFAVGRDRHRIRDWLASVGRDTPAQRGITGEIRFDEHGDAVAKPVLIGSIVP